MPSSIGFFDTTTSHTTVSALTGYETAFSDDDTITFNNLKFGIDLGGDNINEQTFTANGTLSLLHFYIGVSDI